MFGILNPIGARISPEKLNVNPKAFKHYIRKGKKREIPLKFDGSPKIKPIVLAVHYLFSASKHGEYLNGIKIKEGVPKFCEKQGHGSFKGGYDWESSIIYINPQSSPEYTFIILAHEYTHALENSKFKHNAGALLYPNPMYYEQYKKIREILPILELYKEYLALFYSFVALEYSSTRVDLAFTDAVLLKAFYILLGKKENPIEKIEEAMGWEGLFVRDNYPYEPYVRMLDKVIRIIKRNTLSIKERLVSHNLLHLYPYLIFQPEGEPKNTILT